MTKVYRLPSWAGIFLLMAVMALVVFSIPLFLAATGLYALSSFVRNRPTPRSAELSSDVIKTKSIGNYRIKADENDPNIIEVIDP